MSEDNSGQDRANKTPKGHNLVEPGEDAARRILSLDQGILDCNIATASDGAVLADMVKPEFRGKVGGFSHTGSGMGPAWGLSMINMLKRLDKERSKLHYVMVEREKYNAIFFPAEINATEVIIGLLLEKELDPARTYESVMTLL
jgi:hypothetical protein